MSESQPSVPLKIGLTGGIASGKSTVAEMFAGLGVPVIDTDVIARELVARGQPALEDIRQRFGNAVIDASGNLDRVAMRKIIFADEGARADLEAILHPRIGAVTRQSSANAGGLYQVIVVPLLVQSPLREFIDRVLVVDCQAETQIQRLLARDAETREQAERILAAQASRQERLAIADDVIDSERDLSTMKEDVIRLDQEYRRLAQLPYRRAQPPETS